jgi:hypothetical protein
MPISFLAQTSSRRSTADVVVELLIGKKPVFLRKFPLPDQSNLIASPAVEMSVEAVIACIQLSPFKPIDLRLFEIVLQHFIPLLIPIEMIRQFTPKPLRVFDGSFV